MSRNHHPYALTTVLALSATLTACGGSGSSELANGIDPAYVDMTLSSRKNIEIDPDYQFKTLTLQIGEHTFKMQDDGRLTIDINLFDKGLHDYPFVASGVDNQGITTRDEGYMRILKGNYSAVTGTQIRKNYENGVLKEKTNSHDYEFVIDTIPGLPTTIDNIPQDINATYHGQAFSEHRNGRFTYHVDYKPQATTGYGTINFGPQATIALERAALQQFSNDQKRKNPIDVSMTKPDQPSPAFSGKASYSDGRQGEYFAIPFGPHAEEISGAVKEKDAYENTIGFNGTR